MSNVAPGMELAASKAVTSFLSRPWVPTTFTEVAYLGVPSTDLEPLKLWAQQLPALSPKVVHITVSDVTLLGQSRMHRCNQMLRLVHPAIRTVRFRFAVAAVQDLCQQSAGKLIGTPHEFGTRVHDTKDLQHSSNADLGVSHIAFKKGLLEALPFGVGVVLGEWWERPLGLSYHSRVVPCGARLHHPSPLQDGGVRVPPRCRLPSPLYLPGCPGVLTWTPGS